MSKSYVDSLLGFHSAILEDSAMYYPTHHAEFERDKLRLTSLYSSMGAPLFTLALPALGKHLEASLERGFLLRTGLPLTRSINTRTMIPRLFKGLWKEIFEDSGMLKQVVNPRAVWLLRCLCYGSKKFRLTCSDERLFATVGEYYEIDESLPPPSLFWDGDGNDLSRDAIGSLSDLRPSRDNGLFRPPPGDLGESSLLELCQAVADRAASSFGEYISSEWRYKHGPGAVSDSKSGRHYKYAFPAWSPRLERIWPSELYAYADSSLLAGPWISDVVPLKEHHSRLIAVPKTQKAPRLIAAEPTCHQWCQQSVRDFLTTRLSESPLKYTIDFSRQDTSRALALSSSSDGTLATIDLSSASDRLSCYVVQRIFRANISLLGAMISSRTRYIYNEIDAKQPKLHKLRKFAAMGSALTFPVQSIAFAILTCAAGMYTEGASVKEWKQYMKRVRVYGDDIIAPVSWVPEIRHLFSVLWLKINDSKTFSNGKFRESCGADAYDGALVSPVSFLEHPDEAKPSTLRSVVDSANNAHRAGLWRTSRWLESLIPPIWKKFLPVVPAGSGAFGLHTFGNVAQYPGKNRWNTELHRWESLSWVLKPSSLESSRFEGAQNLLQYFTEDPSLSDVTDWESGRFGRPTVRLVRGWVPVIPAAG